MDNVKKYEYFVTFVYLFIILRFVAAVKPKIKEILLNTCSVYHTRKMKRLLLAFSLFFITPVSAAEITSKITDSIQLGVQGAAVQSTRIGASYSVSGSNVEFTNLGGYFGLSTTGAYFDNTPNIANSGQAFTFSETFNAADTVVTSQTVTAGQISSPTLYGNNVTQLAGDKGTLAGTLSPTSVPTVTAGGAGTTATAQRSVELSVFK